MQPDRRSMLKMMAATGAAAITESAVAAQVKWSGSAERPKLKAPADACDCHHHIYDVAYPTDRRGIAFPGDASIADYRALQRRLGIARHVVVQPSTYGLDNRVTLAALAAFGAEARGIVVIGMPCPTSNFAACMSRASAASASISRPPGRRPQR
jgi:D-galactarolactone isomerase